MGLGGLALLALSVNLPLGYLRRRARRYSWQWFVWIHLSIPLIATCRLLSGFGWGVVPWLILAAVTGQVVGGLVRS